MRCSCSMACWSRLSIGKKPRRRASQIFSPIVGYLQWDKARQLARQEVVLAHAQVNILGELSGTKLTHREFDSALRLASQGTRVDLALPLDEVKASPAAAALAAAVSAASWRLVVGGHNSWVHSVAFSPGGSRIVTASEDKTARIWDAATGREIAVLRGPEGGVNSAALQPLPVAHRHDVRGQASPHLGRRDRRRDCGPARP